MGILLSLLGVGKSILGFGLGLFKALLDWAGRHPLLALAIAVDIILLCGCFWGVRQHVTLEKRDAQIVQLQGTIKQDNSLIQTLYQRIKEYTAAIAQRDETLRETIDDNNKAVERLKKAADAQLAAAQKQAEKSKRERDYYAGLVSKYQKPGRNCGTADARIACEEQLNRQFITDFKKAR